MAEGEALDEAAYATRIEEAFIAERGTPFLLSPKDWLLIRGWRERDIPVDSVIRAIRETFERRRTRGQPGKISSIAYCENAVEERWEMERRGLVGQGDATRSGTWSPKETAERLQRLTRRLAEVSRQRPAGVEGPFFEERVTRAADKVGALPPDAGFDTLEEKLSRLEASLLRSLERSLEPSVRASLEDRVSSALGDTAGVSAVVEERMRRALTRREVRRLLGLPALTLFDV